MRLSALVRRPVDPDPEITGVTADSRLVRPGWLFVALTGAKTDGSRTAASADVLAEMTDLVASGAITVPIAATYPLDQVRGAYAQVEKRHTRGKVVLIP